MADSDAVSVHSQDAFKREDRVAWHHCGTWPATSLEAVRAARDVARAALKHGVDPNVKRDADRTHRMPLPQIVELAGTIGLGSARP